MAEFNSRASVLSALDEFDEIDGTAVAVELNYAEIIIIRHGETEWNVDRRIQGQLDVDLNEVGRQQAFAVAERLAKEPKISAIYSSDLKRASDTAEIIANFCGVPEVTIDEHFRERHLGVLQGVLFQEIAKVNPEAYRAFLSDQDNQEIPGGGESFNQMYNRCTIALAKIARKHIGERVALVTHGGPIIALHRRASPHGSSGVKVVNTSINVFLISEDGEWGIKSWGDVSHLENAGFLISGFGGYKNTA